MASDGNGGRRFSRRASANGTAGYSGMGDDEFDNMLALGDDKVNAEKDDGKSYDYGTATEFLDDGRGFSAASSRASAAAARSSNYLSSSDNDADVLSDEDLSSDDRENVNQNSPGKRKRRADPKKKKSARRHAANLNRGTKASDKKAKGSAKAYNRCKSTGSTVNKSGNRRGLDSSAARTAQRASFKASAAKRAEDRGGTKGEKAGFILNNSGTKIPDEALEGTKFFGKGHTYGDAATAIPRPDGRSYADGVVVRNPPLFAHIFGGCNGSQPMTNLSQQLRCMGGVLHSGPRFSDVATNPKGFSGGSDGPSIWCIPGLVPGRTAEQYKEIPYIPRWHDPEGYDKNQKATLKMLGRKG